MSTEQRFTPETYPRLTTYVSQIVNISESTGIIAVPLFWSRDFAAVFHALAFYTNEIGSGGLGSAKIEVGTAGDPDAYGEVGAAALDAASINTVTPMTIDERDIPVNTPVLLKLTTEAAVGEFIILAQIGISTQS